MNEETLKDTLETIKVTTNIVKELSQEESRKQDIVNAFNERIKRFNR